jgi:uncharacterized protein YcgL (UPF0745 family)
MDEYELSLIMSVDVYQTNKNGTYLFLCSSEPFSSLSQPLRDAIGPLYFLNTMELAPARLGTQQSEIQAELENQGYSIHGAKFKITQHV